MKNVVLILMSLMLFVGCEANLLNPELEVGECPDGQIADCRNMCAPEGMVGNGECNDGSFCSFCMYEGGVNIYFDCSEFNYDGGDCDY